jgi:hypothetical protein
MRILITILIAGGAVPALLFVVAYAFRSEGWWRSQLGVNLMLMAIALFEAFGLWLVLRFARASFPEWLWAAILAQIDVTLWWRVVILFKLQNERDDNVVNR